MNKIVRSLTIAAVAFALVGCAATPPVSNLVLEPKSVETVEPSASPEPEKPELTEGETVLMQYLRKPTVLVGVENIPDEVLLEAGWYACELFEEGIDHLEMDVLQGDEAALAAKGMRQNRNDREIAGLASQTICPEYNITE